MRQKRFHGTTVGAFEDTGAKMNGGKPNLKVVEILPKDASVYAEALSLINDTKKLVEDNKVFAVGLAILYEDGSIGTAWSKGSANSVFKFLGALEHLKNRYYHDEIESL